MDGESMTPYEEWVAYHALQVIKDPSYLQFMTDKLQKCGSMDAVSAADMCSGCDTACERNVAEHLSQLTVEQLEIVGI